MGDERSERQRLALKLASLANEFPRHKVILLKAARELTERRGRGRPRKTSDSAARLAAGRCLALDIDVVRSAMVALEVRRSYTAGEIKNRVEYLARKTRRVLRSLSPQERDTIVDEFRAAEKVRHSRRVQRLAQKRFYTGVK
jgi:hypothetical protein